GGAGLPGGRSTPTWGKLAAAEAWFRGARSSSARRGPPPPWWRWPPSPSPTGSSKSKRSPWCEGRGLVSGINPYIFRAYDVRGKVGIDITPDVFAQVGRAYGTLVRRRGGETGALRT